MSPLWECRPIVELNERILVKLGGEGLTPPVPEPGWERSPEFEKEADEARWLLDDLFAGKPLWGWKDPRTCLTLPFWRRLVPSFRYVVCLRNPHDAVASVVEHLSMTRSQVARTWLVYVASALVNTAGAERTFVAYEEYFANPDSQIQQLGRLASEGSPPPLKVRESLSAVIEERKRHFHSRTGELHADSDFRQEVALLYLSLELLRSSSSDLDADSGGHRRALSDAVDLFAGWTLDALRQK
jgi:hypothetical protein